MKHALKVDVRFFDHLWTGEKTFELRFDDRGFQVGDLLDLYEWDREKGETGRQVLRRVTYILRDFGGLIDGWCVLGLGEPLAAQGFIR